MSPAPSTKSTGPAKCPWCHDVATLQRLHALENGLEPTCTVLDVLEDLQALGCERAGAMLERERGRA